MPLGRSAFPTSDGKRDLVQEAPARLPESIDVSIWGCGSRYANGYIE